MLIIDRYLFWTFFRVALFLFISLAGLLIVIDALSNSDELVHCAKRAGSVWRVLLDHYGARTLLLFDWLGGMLAMAGAMFAITWLQRANELTALAAAGISYSRMLRAIVCGAMLLSLMGMANREWGVPSVRAQLSRNIKDWAGEAAIQFSPKYDPSSEVLLRGVALLAKDRRIESPNFMLPPECGEWGKELTAPVAFFQDADGDKPSGWLFPGVKQPANLHELNSVKIQDRPVVLSPKDTPWLKPGQAYVVSNLSFEELYVGSPWRHYLSTRELITGLKTRSLENSNEIKILLHSRFLQPLVDLTVLFLGLPLVLRRDSRKIFVTVGMCMGLIAAYFCVTLLCRSLGNNYLLSPALAAWGPLLAFGPIAYSSARPLWD